MFCKFCGKELADDAKFCASCGNPVATAAPAATAPQMPAVFGEFVEMLKGLLNPAEGIGIAAKSTGYAGAIGIGLYYFVYLFFNCVAAYQDGYGRYVSFGGMFAISLAMGAIYLALIFLAFFGVVSFASGKVANPFACMNVFGVALMPSVAAMILNFGFGFVWSPLANFFYTIGAIALWLILWFAVGKLEEKPVRNYFWIACAAFACAEVLANFINNKIMIAYLL